jgi:hypothetical protein
MEPLLDLKQVVQPSPGIYPLAPAPFVQLHENREAPFGPQIADLLPLADALQVKRVRSIPVVIL